MEKTTERNFQDVKSTLKQIQANLGKPFEQFGRNIVVKLLKKEGIENVSLEAVKISDPERMVSEGTTQIEIDGFSLDPPIIVEITSIFQNIEKIDTFLKKKQFVEKKYERPFRGFFVAASSEFSPEQMGEISIRLREKNCELINL